MGARNQHYVIRAYLFLSCLCFLRVVGKSRSAIEEKIFRMRGSGSKYGGNYYVDAQVDVIPKCMPSYVILN